MPTLLFKFLVSFVLVITTAGLAHGQDVKAGQGPTGKVIEVHSSRSPRPSVIALSPERPSGFWASGFARTKDWKMPSTGDPVQAIDFRARLVGDKGELIISLLSGIRFGENTETVARVLISEGETVVVTELKKFGYGPVTVKMLSTTTAIADTPLVSNPSPMLRTTVSSVVATLPTFNIKFQNDSSKDIWGFEWHTETDGRRLMSGVAQGRYGKALIEANGSYEMNIKAIKRESDLNPVTMVIGAVIFRDGSIEGDPKAAAPFLSYMEGRRKALDQLVPLLQKASEKRSQRTDIAALIAAVDSLTHGEPRVNGRPSDPVGIAFGSVITEAIQFLRRLDSDSVGKSDAEVQAGISELANFFRDWQNRMQK